ncbi:lectin-like domain-containing protein [Cesiribacter andamanensis]|uniref:Ig-like domain-containing protein n=1 Tax=Cesiribacter andamanensis AMV16 TaxID=1279009 RepID=M7N5Q0_9BACT|nr:gliding motility-associated C-terminal domain-containing protein [Cesiribacter andamanensis]EMR03958.1 hypothetical protein ADICEAN_00925 [Cesiribacter andamanensis AMV16]
MLFLKYIVKSAVTARCILFRIALVVGCALTPTLVSAQFVTRGDAVKVSERCFKVTEDKEGRFGAVWWERQIDLREPVELDFVIYLGTRDEDGADGIAFVLHNDVRGLNAKGTPGGGLGFAYHPTYTDDQTLVRVIKPSVAIEFDTYYNRSFVNELEADHTTIVYDGDLDHIILPALPINPDNPNVEDGGCNDYKIKWNPANFELELYFNGKLRFRNRDDIVTKVFGGNPIVYYGFTGSTGGSKNEQTICIFEAESKPVAIADVVSTEHQVPVTIDVLANDSHTTGDALGIGAIIKQPLHGSVQIVNNSLVYTPAFGFVGTDVFTYEACETGSDLCYSKCASAQVRVEVVCSQVLPTPQVADAFRCGPGEVQFTAQAVEAPGGTYRWYASASHTVPIYEAEGTLFITPLLQRTTTFWVSFFDGACEGDRTSVTAIVQPLPEVYAGEDTRLYIGEELQLQGYGEGQISWSPSEGLSDMGILTPIANPQATTTYTLTITDASGCIATDEITITVVDGIFVPNAFSPNGDGLNDYWEILKIAKYPACTVSVFDRWGVVVFESKGYAVPWDGMYKGKKLPLGSYAYVIDLGEGGKPQKGIVSLVH